MGLIGWIKSKFTKKKKNSDSSNFYPPGYYSRTEYLNSILPSITDISNPLNPISPLNPIHQINYQSDEPSKNTEPPQDYYIAPMNHPTSQPSGHSASQPTTDHSGHSHSYYNDTSSSHHHHSHDSGSCSHDSGSSSYDSGSSSCDSGGSASCD